MTDQPAYDDLRATLEAEQHINRVLSRNVLEAQAERDCYKRALEASKAFDDHRLECREDICFERSDLWHKQRELTVAALAGSSDAGGAP